MSRPLIDKYLSKDKNLREKQLYLLSKRLEDLKELKSLETNSQIERAKECLTKPRDCGNNNTNDSFIPEFTRLKGAYSSEDEYKKFMNNYWKRRTNIPYKHVINDEKHYKHLLEESKCKGQLTKEELIVHITNKEDKDTIRLENEYKDKKSQLNKQNKDFGLIYSVARRPEHKKNFDYNHVHRFRRDCNFTEHIKEQKKIEQNKESTIQTAHNFINEMDKGQLEKLGIEPVKVLDSTRVTIG